MSDQEETKDLRYKVDISLQTGVTISKDNVVHKGYAPDNTFVIIDDEGNETSIPRETIIYVNAKEVKE